MLTQPVALKYALACSSALLAGFFVYFYFEKRKAYLVPWTWAWFIFALLNILPLHFSRLRISDATVKDCREWLLFLAALAFVKAARSYAHAPTHTRWLVAAAGAAAIWLAAFHFGWVTIPLRLATLVAFLLVAQQFMHESRKQQALAEA